MPITHKEDALLPCYIGSVVHMPKHKVVHILRSAIFGCEVNQWLQHIDIDSCAVRLARFATPPLAKTDKVVGMDKRRGQSTQSLRAEHLVHQTQNWLALDVHIITVRHEQLLARDVKSLWCSVEFYATLLSEVVAYPHIVVSRKHHNAHALIVQLCQATKHTHKALWHNLLILEPKVEDVAHQKECLDILLNIGQEVEKEALHTALLRHIARAKMYVRYEIVHTLILENFSQASCQSATIEILGDNITLLID